MNNMKCGGEICNRKQQRCPESKLILLLRNPFFTKTLCRLPVCVCENMCVRVFEYIWLETPAQATLISLPIVPPVWGGRLSLFVRSPLCAFSLCGFVFFFFSFFRCCFFVFCFFIQAVSPQLPHADSKWHPLLYPSLSASPRRVSFRSGTLTSLCCFSSFSSKAQNLSFSTSLPQPTAPTRPLPLLLIS